MILLTTSLRPTRRIRTLCCDLAHSISDITRVNRGKMNLREVGEKAVEVGAEKIVIIDRWKGGADKIRFFKIDEGRLNQVLPRIYIRGIKLKREFNKPKRTFYTSLLCINGTNKENQDIKKLEIMMSNFFGIPIIDSNEKMAKYRTAMSFSVDSYQLLHISFYAITSGIEIGPRITASHAVWEN